MFSETYIPQARCPMCGAILSEAESYQPCKFCGAELKRKGLDVLHTPSEQRPDVLTNVENKLVAKGDILKLYEINPDEQKIIARMWDIINDVLPDPAAIEDPKSFFKKTGKENLSLALDNYLDGGVYKAEQKLENMIYNGSDELSKQQRYEILIRLKKWFMSQSTLFEKYIHDATQYMVGVSSYRPGESETPEEQARNGFEPEKMVGEMLGKLRARMISDLNGHVLWAGGQGEWKWKSERSFHPRFVEYLLEHLNEVQGIELEEVRLLLTSLKYEGQNPKTTITNESEYKETLKAYAQKQMSRADRLLELLYHPQLLPQVEKVFENRAATIAKEDLPEWQEWDNEKRGKDSRDDNALPGWKQFEQVEEKSLGGGFFDAVKRFFSGD